LSANELETMTTIIQNEFSHQIKDNPELTLALLKTFCQATGIFESPKTAVATLLVAAKYAASKLPNESRHATVVGITNESIGLLKDIDNPEFQMDAAIEIFSLRIHSHLDEGEDANARAFIDMLNAVVSIAGTKKHRNAIQELMLQAYAYKQKRQGIVN